jgi:antitoxin component YwqK of YwqJK toxin-antitoxin module
MKKLSLPLLTFLLFLSPNVVLSETMDDLVYSDGLYYNKFSQVPFSGVTTGKSQGTIKNGIREGAWITYHPNGQLKSKGNYKNGKTDGSWVYNYEIGVMD